MLNQSDLTDADMPQDALPQLSEDTPHEHEGSPTGQPGRKHTARRTRATAWLPQDTSQPQWEPPPLPAHTPIPTAAILDSTLPAQALQTLARLYAAAQPHDYRHTSPLEFDRQLVPLLHASRTQVRNTLRLLRLAKLIDWSSDGARRYTIHLLSPESHKAAVADSYDVVENQTEKTVIRQHHPTDSEGAESQDGFLTVLDCLLRAGVWTDAALRIDSQITTNVRRGHTYLPDLRDVLGWIAFCFAYQRENKLSNPAAVLAANLNANRRCPEKNRPPYICNLCHRDEAHCACDDPDLRLPPKFLEYAFTDEFDARTQSFWGVCRRCHAFPCACQPGEEVEQPPEEKEYGGGDTRGW